MEQSPGCVRFNQIKITEEKVIYRQIEQRGERLYMRLKKRMLRKRRNI